MSHILELPPELSDHIFSYLPLADQKRARLVCRQWHHRLSTSRFRKATKLRLTPYFCRRWRINDLLRAAGQGIFTNIEVSYFCPPIAGENLIPVILLLKASRFSLEEIQLTPTMHKFYSPDLLWRYWNKLHLPVLHSLTMTTPSLRQIQAEALDGRFWKILEQLTTLKCTETDLCGRVLTQMLPYCKNLKYLAIKYYHISSQCVRQIFALKGLEDLSLTSVIMMGSSERFHSSLDLSNLKHMLTSTEIDSTMAEPLPRLTSVAFEGHGMSCSPNLILSQLHNMYGIGGQRCRKLTLKLVSLDRQANDWLRSMSIDVLSLDCCFIHDSLLDALVQPQTRRSVLKIVMHRCTICLHDQTHRLRTVAELRVKCPWVEIVDEALFFL